MENANASEEHYTIHELNHLFSWKLVDNTDNLYLLLLIPTGCFSFTDHYSIRNDMFNIEVNSFADITSIHDYWGNSLSEIKHSQKYSQCECHSLKQRVYKVEIAVLVSCTVIGMFQ